MELEILFAEIQGLYEDGFTVSEIAFGLNLKPATIWAVVKSTR